MLTDTPKIQYQKEVEVWVKSFGETSCMNPQKRKTKIKMRSAKKYKAIYCTTCRTGYRSSRRIWSMKVVLQSQWETLRQRIETLPVLLMNCQWSREQKWNRVRVSIVSTRTFRRTQAAKNNEVFLQKTCWYSRAQSGTFSWLDCCGSNKCQWRKWIAKQSSICRSGTSFGSSVVGQGLGSPRQVRNRRWRTRKGPELACVQKPLSTSGWHMQGEKGELRTLPWYRRVGVAKKNPVWRKEEVPGCPYGQVAATWYGDDSPYLPWNAPAGENGQNSGEIGGSSPWTRPSAPACGDTLKALAGHGSIWCGDRPRRRHRVAIDWVTGPSYSCAEKATRRLNVQSGLRKGKQCCGRPARA